MERIRSKRSNLLHTRLNSWFTRPTTISQHDQHRHLGPPHSPPPLERLLSSPSPSGIRRLQNKILGLVDFGRNESRSTIIRMIHQHNPPVCVLDFIRVAFFLQNTTLINKPRISHHMYFNPRMRKASSFVISRSNPPRCCDSLNALNQGLIRGPARMMALAACVVIEVSYNWG